MGSRRTRLGRIFVLVIILAIAFGGFRFLVSTRPSAPPIAAEEPIWPVNAEIARKGNHAPVITLFGRITSPQTTTLVAAITADILTVPVHDGDKVTTNQLLVQLDDQDTRLLLRQREAEYNEAQALLQSENIHHQSNLRSLDLDQELVTLAQNELQRAKRLKEDQLASQTRIDEAQQAVVRQQLSLEQRKLAINDHQATQLQLEARVAKADVQRELIRVDLTRTRIKAPYPATISQVYIATGGRVRAGDPLIELFEQDSLEVRAQIPSLHVPVLRTALDNNSRLIATLAAESRMPHETEIAANFKLDRLTSNIKTGNSSVEAILSIEGNASKFAQGQVVELLMQLPIENDVITLPVEAIYGSNRIYKITEERLSSQSIERLGITYDSQGAERVMLRSSQLKDGDHILTTQLPNAIDGMRVKPQFTP